MSRFLHARRAAVALAAVAVTALPLASPASAVAGIQQTTDWTNVQMCQGDQLTFRTTFPGLHNFTVTLNGVPVAISPPTTKDAPAAVPVIGSPALLPNLDYRTSDTVGSAGSGTLSVIAC